MFNVLFNNKYIKYTSNLKNGFVNHLPMVLYSLYELRVPLTEIERFGDEAVAKQTSEMEDLTVRYHINKENFKEYLGKNDALGSFCEFYENQNKSTDIISLVKNYLPILMKGVGAKLFHCLIRLAIAIRSGNDKEIIRSLAYFSASYVAYNSINNIKPSVNIIDEFNALVKATEDRSAYNSIREVYSLPAFQNNMVFLNGTVEEDLKNLDNLINLVYLSHSNIITLHGVTSKEALKSLLTYCINKKEVINDYWCAIVATYIANGIPQMINSEVILPNNLLDFSEIIKRAIESKEYHTIKLTNSCFIEYNSSNNEIYRYIAQTRYK